MLNKELFKLNKLLVSLINNYYSNNKSDNIIYGGQKINIKDINENIGKNKKYFDIIFNKLNKFNNQKGGLNQQMSYNQQPPMQYNQPPPMQYNQLPPMQYNQPPMQYNQPPPQYNQPPPMPFGPDSEK